MPQDDQRFANESPRDPESGGRGEDRALRLLTQEQPLPSVSVLIYTLEAFEFHCHMNRSDPTRPFPVLQVGNRVTIQPSLKQLAQFTRRDHSVSRSREYIRRAKSYRRGRDSSARHQKGSLMNCEIPCPECDGAGFYGGNGPVVECICAFCHGTGIHEPAEDITARPPDRAYVSVYSDPKHREAVEQIASDMRERLDRTGS